MPTREVLVPDSAGHGNMPASRRCCEDFIEA